MDIGNTAFGKYLPDDFYAEVYELLEAHPAGISEYELLQCLKKQGYFDFVTGSPAAPHELFQMHFLLFHVLYHIRQHALQEQTAIVHISPLNIRLSGYQSGQSAMTEHDPLSEYYLDLDNMIDTSAADVDALLDAFWETFVRQNGRAAALAELGLADPVDDVTIKQTYRRLAMEHHPDRGGDRWKLQAINSAYEALCKRKR